MSVLHIINHDNNLPVCGRANFERDMLTGKDYFIANHDDEERCWECGSIIGIDVTAPTPPPATCEHGLSADLCAGPGHYPKDM